MNTQRRIVAGPSRECGIPVDTSAEPLDEHPVLDYLGDLFSFDDFSEDLSEDFDFLFSEHSEVGIPPEGATTLPFSSSAFESSARSNAVSTSIYYSKSETHLKSLPREQLDMNDPAVLDLYTQLVIFQQDFIREEFVFPNADPAMQDTLHSLSRKLNLEYEHSLRPEQVKISKSRNTPVSVSGMEFDDSSFRDSGLFSGEASSLNSTLSSTGLNHQLAREVHLNALNWPQTAEVMRSEDVQDTSSTSLVWENVMSGLEDQNSDISEDVLRTSLFTIGNSLRTSTPVINQDSFDSLTSRKTLSRKNSSLKGTEDVKLKVVSGLAFTHGSTAAARSEYIFQFDPAAASKNIDPRGRRGGPVSIARSDPNVVEPGNSCWKCKAGRKKCDAQSPCSCCLRGEHDSVWKAIGCRRGAIECQVPHQIFCPKRRTDEHQMTIHTYLNTNPNLSTQSNLQEPNLNPQSDQLQDILSKIPLPLQSPGSSILVSKVDMLSAEIEYLKASLSQTFTEDSLAHVLKTTGIYGSDFSGLMDSITLSSTNVSSCISIEKSLVCLRGCLRILQANACGKYTTHTHDDCTAATCAVEYARDLETNLREYLNEVSREMFKKKNLRGDKSWWLPAFYSLCIQSYVAKTLRLFTLDPKTRPTIYDPGNSMHLPVRLFEALSSGFDPMIPSQDPLVTSPVQIDPQIQAMIRKLNPNASAQTYLKYLFEIKDECMVQNISLKGDPLLALALRSISQERPIDREKSESVGIQHPDSLMPRDPGNNPRKFSLQMAAEFAAGARNPVHREPLQEQYLTENDCETPKASQISDMTTTLSANSINNAHSSIENWTIMSDGEAASTFLDNLKAHGSEYMQLIDSLLLSFIETGELDIILKFFQFTDQKLFEERLQGRVRWDWCDMSEWAPDKPRIPPHLRHEWLHGHHESHIVLSKPVLPVGPTNARRLFSTFLHHLLHSYFYASCGSQAGRNKRHTEGFSRVVEGIDAAAVKFASSLISSRRLKGAPIAVSKDCSRGYGWRACSRHRPTSSQRVLGSGSSATSQDGNAIH